MAAPVVELQQEEKLVELWPDYPCLYDVRSTDFKNRTLREASISELERKVNQSAEWIKRKLRSLRNTYTRLRAISKSGSARKPASPRNQWLKYKLQFLEPFVATRGNSIDSLSTPSTSSADASFNDSEGEEEEEEFADSGNCNYTGSSSEPLKKRLKVNKTPKKKNDEEELKLIKQIAESAIQQPKTPGRCPLVERSLGLGKITKTKKAWIMVNNVYCSTCELRSLLYLHNESPFIVCSSTPRLRSACCVLPNTPDKFELFGQYVSAFIKEFDDTTRHIVQHRISSIIFEAQMGMRQPQPHTPASTSLSDDTFFHSV